MKKIVAAVVVSAVVVSAFAGPEYEAKSKRIGQGKFKGQITYLAKGNDLIYALEHTGKVHGFSPESGNRKVDFDTGLYNTQSLAVNKKGEIYVFATSTRKEQRTHNNRKYDVEVPIGVTCKVFNKSGKEIRTMDLPELKSAKAAQFTGENLVVADLGERKLIFIDLETGKKTAEVAKGLRICCGIFDFCVDPEGNVAVANLGAFEVQQYNNNGKKVGAFGKRGKGFDEFHGCCNPVSVNYLPDGSILTVEKSPTRVKVYDSKGKNATSIDGIEELVQGCSHIPLVVDDDGNAFLAAGRKGYIVKVVPK